MLDPDKLQNIDEKNKNEITTISFDSEIPSMDIEEYNLFDEKDMKKYMTDLENLVRKSMEYRKEIQFCRQYMNMNKCSFYENVNNIDTFKIKIELHHTPFGLYDICRIVLNKRIFYHESLDVEDVAEEVTLLHYCGMVGLIPLSETVHELVHKFYLFVPLSSVWGRYDLFVDMYGQFFDPEHHEVYDRIKAYSEIYDFNKNSNILERKYIHIDFSGAYKLPKLEDIVNMISNRVLDIRKGYNIPLNEQINQKPVDELLTDAIIMIN